MGIDERLKAIEDSVRSLQSQVRALQDAVTGTPDGITAHPGTKTIVNRLSKLEKAVKSLEGRNPS